MTTEIRFFGIKKGIKALTQSGVVQFCLRRKQQTAANYPLPAPAPGTKGQGGYFLFVLIYVWRVGTRLDLAFFFLS
jgi:hypothetical protein